MFIYRRLLEIQFKLNLITLLERLYYHEKLTARYYRTLAAQDMDTICQGKFLALALTAEQRASDYARQIRRAGAIPPKECDNWTGHLWYWLLLHSGQYLARHWLAWCEYLETESLNSLLFTRYVW